MFHFNFTRLFSTTAVLWAALLPMNVTYAQENVSDSGAQQEYEIRYEIEIRQENEAAVIAAFLEDVDVTMSEITNFNAYAADTLKLLLDTTEKLGDITPNLGELRRIGRTSI
ncbi:MAG: hypothetical protein LBT05_09465 [Planctomycetaceae bacterium]|nr:hypothetical protein [Planctomycetaceae bacterium]